MSWTGSVSYHPGLERINPTVTFWGSVLRIDYNLTQHVKIALAYYIIVEMRVKGSVWPFKTFTCERLVSGFTSGKKLDKTGDRVAVQLFWIYISLKIINIEFTMLQILTVTFIIMFFKYRNDADPDNNLRVGLVLVVSFFLVISVLAFPNGTGMGYFHSPSTV